MRGRLTEESLERSSQHSEEHRGKTGRFGDFFTIELNLWKAPERKDNEIAIIPYYSDVKVNGLFRSSNPDLNIPFTQSQFEKGDTYDFKLNVLTHSNMGPNQDTVICLGMIRQPCPICELRKVLSDEREQEDEDVRRLYTRRSTLYNILVMTTLADIEKGLQVWMAPTASIQEALDDRRRVPHSGELRGFAYPEAGWNVSFAREGVGIKTKYKNVDIVKRRPEDEFSKEDIDALVDQAIDFESVIEVLPYATLKEMLEGTKLKGISDSRYQREDRGSRSPREDRREDREDRGSRAPREDRREDREDRGSRFRGKEREASNNDQKEERKPEREERKPGREETPECFGKQNQELQACEDCNVWERCYTTQEEHEKEKVSEPKRGLERSGGVLPKEEERTSSPKSDRGAKRSRFAK